MKLLSTFLLTGSKRSCKLVLKAVLAQAQENESTLRDHLSIDSKYYISTTKSSNADQSCADLGGKLAVLTDENTNYIAAILPKGKFTVGGATKPDKCNLFTRSGKETKNKKCRKQQFICDLTVPEPECTPDNSVSLESHKYLTVVTSKGDEPYSRHEARDFCSDLGEFWGLTIINSEAELATITSYLSAQCHR